MASTPLPETTRLAVRVQPGARVDTLVGYGNGVWQIRLKAPPIEGKANTRLLQFLADLLGVRPRDLTLVSGAHAREKVIAVAGLSPGEVTARLEAARAPYARST